MSFTKFTALAACVASVSAHGYVNGFTVAGTYYEGWLVANAYQTPEPDSYGWADTNLDLGFESPSEYGGPNIICAQNATNAALSAPANAGDEVNLQWTAWPESHHGPVITYMANCGDDCSTVDKTTLKFFKIDEGGLIDDTDVPGTWASDQLISNNNSRTVTIPSDLASGNYVMRHEIIALHGAESQDGAQNYPQCLNFKVTGTGSLAPEGTLGESLYTETDPGILVNIYASLSSYTIPGPAMYNATGAATGAASATSAASVATSAAAVTTSAVAATSAVSSVAVSSAAGAVVSTTAASPSTFATSVASSTAAAAATSAAAPADDDSCDA